MVIAFPAHFAATLAIALVIGIPLLVPTSWAVPISALGSTGLVIMVPSSAFEGFPLGAFYPAFLSLYFLTAGIFRTRKTIARPTLIVPIGLFYLVLFGASLGALRTNVFYVLVGLVGLGTYWLASSADDLGKKRILVGIVGIAALQAVLAVAEASFGLGPALGREITISVHNPYFPDINRSQGTLDHPLVLGFVLLVGFGVVLAGFTGPWRKGLPLGLLLVCGIVATGSTSVTFAAVLMFCIWAVSQSGPLGRTLLALALLAGAGFASSTGVGARILGGDFEELAIDHRLNSILAVENLIQARTVFHSLFGNGLHSAPELFAQNIFRNDGFLAIDNQFVSALAEAGVVGLVLFVVFMALFLLRTTAPYRPLAISLFFMTISFDFLAWLASASMFFMIVAIALERNRTVPLNALPPPTPLMASESKPAVAKTVTVARG